MKNIKDIDIKRALRRRIKSARRAVEGDAPEIILNDKFLLVRDYLEACYTDPPMDTLTEAYHAAIHGDVDSCLTSLDKVEKHVRERKWEYNYFRLWTEYDTDYAIRKIRSAPDRIFDEDIQKKYDVKERRNGILYWSDGEIAPMEAFSDDELHKLAE